MKKKEYLLTATLQQLLIMGCEKHGILLWPEGRYMWPTSRPLQPSIPSVPRHQNDECGVITLVVSTEEVGADTFHHKFDLMRRHQWQGVSSRHLKPAGNFLILLLHHWNFVAPAGVFFPDKLAKKSTSSSTLPSPIPTFFSTGCQTSFPACIQPPLPSRLSLGALFQD